MNLLYILIIYVRQKMESSKMTLGNYTQFNMLGMGSSMGYQNFLGGGLGMGNFNIGGMLGGCNMFQSCDGSYNYDAMAGMAVGNVLVNCLFGFLGQAVSSRQAKKANSPEATLETLKNNQSDLATKLETANKAYDTAKEAYIGADGNGGAKKAYEDNQAILVGYNATEVAETIRLYKTYVETGKQDEYKGTATLPDEAAYKKALEQQEAKKNESSLKTAMEKAKNAFDAADTAKTEAQSAYDTVTQQIEKLETEQKQVTNDQILDKADGHSYQQTKQEVYEAKFDADGNFKSKTTKKVNVLDNDGNVTGTKDVECDTEVTKSDLRYAIQQYRNAKAVNDTKKMQQFAKQLVQLWDVLPAKDKGDRNLQAALKIIKEEQNIK